VFRRFLFAKTQKKQKAQNGIQPKGWRLPRFSARDGSVLWRDAWTPPIPSEKNNLCYNKPVTIKQSLVWATKILKKSRNHSPALDAEILLAFAIKKPKEFLYAHPEKKLTTREWNQFKKLIARRAKHEPIAYITSHKYFYGLDFFVNKNVLIPRPETELLVNETIKKVNSKQTTDKKMIIDVGAGSGCIAVSLAHHLPNAKIFAAEISSGAIKVAQKNIKRHKAAVSLLRGNLLEPFLKRIRNHELGIRDLIVAANLPYLTTRQWKNTQPEIKKYEPRTALDGGKDGLNFYRQLLQRIKLLITNYHLQITSIFEIDPRQTKSIVKLIHQYFGKTSASSRPLLRFCDIKKDLAGRDRVVIFKI
jgi:release factor glutamine methyltransferase